MGCDWDPWETLNSDTHVRAHTNSCPHQQQWSIYADNAELHANQLFKKHQRDPCVRRIISSALDDWFTQLCDKIDEFLLILHNKAPDAKIRYICIMPHPYWSTYGRDFAARLDGYVLNGISRHYRIRMLQLRCMYRYRLKLPHCSDVHNYVLPGLLDNKGVHIIRWGYSVFVMDVVIPLLHCWFSYLQDLQARRWAIELDWGTHDADRAMHHQCGKVTGPQGMYCSVMHLLCAYY